MSQARTFTSEEWQTLQFGPFWVFSALLGAYKNFDPMEYEAFARSLHQASTAPGELARQIVDSVLLERGRLTEMYQADSRTIALGLCGVAVILKKAPTGEAELVKEMLISHIGVRIAQARGRFGRVMSEDDENTLELISQFLF